MAKSARRPKRARESESANFDQNQLKSGRPQWRFGGISAAGCAYKNADLATKADEAAAAVALSLNPFGSKPGLEVASFEPTGYRECSKVLV